jgi:hypothetical protein
MGNASALAGLLLLFGAASASPAGAQTATTVDGAYARLSTGNAKIARALFEAQVTNTTPTSGGGATTGGTTTAPKPLTLDQIAALKQGGQGWGQVFHSMQAQGLVTDRNLGQVVSRYQHQQNVNTGGVVTTAANRTITGGNGGAVRVKGDTGDGSSVGGGNGNASGNGGTVSAGNGSNGGGNGNAFGHAGGGGNPGRGK